MQQTIASHTTDAIHVPKLTTNLAHIRWFLNERIIPSLCFKTQERPVDDIKTPQELGSTINNFNERRPYVTDRPVISS